MYKHNDYILQLNPNDNHLILILPTDYKDLGIGDFITTSQEYEFYWTEFEKLLYPYNFRIAKTKKEFNKVKSELMLIQTLLR